MGSLVRCFLPTHSGWMDGANREVKQGVKDIGHGRREGLGKKKEKRNNRQSNGSKINETDQLPTLTSSPSMEPRLPPAQPHAQLPQAHDPDGDHDVAPPEAVDTLRGSPQPLKGVPEKRQDLGPGEPRRRVTTATSGCKWLLWLSSSPVMALSLDFFTPVRIVK